LAERRAIAAEFLEYLLIGPLTDASVERADFLCAQKRLLLKTGFGKHLPCLFIKFFLLIFAAQYDIFLNI
jgi:hypothetical protein